MDGLSHSQNNNLQRINCSQTSVDYCVANVDYPYGSTEFLTGHR